MKILITGNLGYVGPVLVKHLRANYSDLKLIGLDTGFFAHCLLGDTEYFPDVALDQQIYCDIRNITDDLFRGVDSIVHLAGLSNDPLGNLLEGLTENINFDASTDLALKAKKAGVRNFVFASSCSVYGEADGVPKRESDQLNPLTAYAKSKINFEKVLQDLASDNFVITALRFATACGMSPRLRLDLVLNDFVASAISVGKIEILSDGTPWRPLIHVKDMARAVEWAISRVGSNGGNFLAVNTGSDEWNYRVIDLAASVASEFSGVELHVNANAVKDNRSYKVDFSLFKSLAPNHQPLISLRDAIAELKEELLRNKFSDKNFRSSNLIRLFALKNLVHRKVLNNSFYWNLKN